MFTTAGNYSFEHIFFSDFITSQNGEDGWTVASSGGTMSGAINTDSDHPGILTCSYVSAATDRAAIRFSVNSHQGGGGDYYIQFLMRFETLSNATDEYVFSAGIFDTTNADAVDGIYFEYDRATAGDFWRTAASNNSTRTKNTSSVATSAGSWVRVGIELNAAWNRAKYFINGALVDTITTNIPTGTARTTTPYWGFRKTAGTGAADVASVDSSLIRFSQTTPLWNN